MGNAGVHPSAFSQWLFQWDQTSVNPSGLALSVSLLCDRTAFFYHNLLYLFSSGGQVHDARAAEHNHCPVYLLAAPFLSVLCCLQAPDMLSSHVLRLPSPSGSYFKFMVPMMVFYYSSEVTVFLC